MRYYISHSAKGTTWKNHKYIAKIDGRYIYDSVTALGKLVKDSLIKVANKAIDKNAEKLGIRGVSTASLNNPLTYLPNYLPLSESEKKKIEASQKEHDKKVAEWNKTHTIGYNSAVEADEEKQAKINSKYRTHGILRRQKAVITNGKGVKVRKRNTS